MSRTRKVFFSCAIVAMGLLFAPIVGAEKIKGSVPTAPAPAQILTGRKVFIAYAGINTMSLNSYIVDTTGALNGLYDEFYAAITKWEGYQVVSTPADADLVFDLSLRQVRGEDPHFVLKILDPKSNVLLWAFMENVPGGSGRAARKRKAWDEALASLANQVRDLAGRQRIPPLSPAK